MVLDLVHWKLRPALRSCVDSQFVEPKNQPPLNSDVEMQKNDTESELSRELFFLGTRR